MWLIWFNKEVNPQVTCIIVCSIALVIDHNLGNRICHSLVQLWFLSKIINLNLQEFCRGTINFLPKSKLFRDALKIFQNFSEKIYHEFMIKNHIYLLDCCMSPLNFENFWKNHQNFSRYLPNFKTLPWWLSQQNGKYTPLELWPLQPP